VVRIIKGAKSSSAVSLTPAEWDLVLQHKDSVLNYLHGSYNTCKTSDLIVYDLECHELLLKETYGKRSLIINDCLPISDDGSAGESRGTDADAAAAGAPGATADANNDTTAVHGVSSVIGIKNEAAAAAAGKKRSVLAAALETVSEKPVVERKRVKSSLDYTGVAMHAPTVEAFYELEDVVQLKLAELTANVDFVNNIFTSLVACIQRDTRDESLDDLKKVFHSEKGFKVYFNSARSYIEKEVRSVLVDEAAVNGAKFDARIFEHSFTEIQRVWHRDLVTEIFERL